MSDLPDRREARTPAAHQLSNEEFEQMIRRAAELQARAADSRGGEGLTEAEAVRIGRELGLSDANLARALAEVRAGGEADTGIASRIMGPSGVSVGRAVSGEAGVVARRLESYLVDQEYMVVQRRLADRLVLVRASGMVAAVGRTASEIFRRAPLLSVETLELSVRPLEAGRAFVLLYTNLSGHRRGHFAGGIALGTVFAGAGGAALAAVLAPPAAILAVPLLAGGVGIVRQAYREQARKVATQFESLLDRLEHDELTAGRGWLSRPGS